MPVSSVSETPPPPPPPPPPPRIDAIQADPAGSPAGAPPASLTPVQQGEQLRVADRGTVVPVADGQPQQPAGPAAPLTPVQQGDQLRAAGQAAGPTPATPPAGMAKCFGPPPAPGTAATPQDLTNLAHANGDQAAGQTFNPLNLLWFKGQVQNKGPWDYKQANPGYQDFGNYNYGYTGAAMHVSRDFLLQQAGAAQIAAGTSQPDWGHPGFLGMLGGQAPYGDDPHDQQMIMQGFADRANGC